MQPAEASSSSSPNVIFILVDDLGWEDLGYMGSSYYQTPNIDALAKNSKRFSQAYANSPNCAPTRAALMSGQYAPRTKVYTVEPKDRGKAANRALLTPENNRHLKPRFDTLAEQFQDNGYRTGFFGKWHLGEAEGPENPLAQGFDLNLGGHHKGHPRSYFSPYKNPALEDGPKGEYLTDRLTSEALTFIEDGAEGDKPFFAFLSYYAVHTPIQPKPDLLGKYEKIPYEQRQGHPGYAAMVETLDNNIGLLLDYLQTSGLDKNTVIIFTSDNGGSGKATEMPSLKGVKGMLYEGGVRVPLFYHWAGKISAGDVDIPTVSIDHYPTLLQLAEMGIGDKLLLDGIDLSPLLMDRASADEQAALYQRPLYWHFPFYLQKEQARKKPFPVDAVSTPHGWRAEPGGSIRKGDYKLIEYFDGNQLELFNLKEDLSESHNLAESQPEKVKELHELMKQWRSKTQADMPTGRNPKFESHP